MSITLPSGARLGRYEIRSQLGAGGMGEVYLAQDPELNRVVALKILPAGIAQDQQRIHRFVQEAKAAAALSHPNIAHIYEIGEADNVRFIAMEYVEGQTLRQGIARKPVEINRALDVAMQVASALSAAHAAGIIHRDIKPENIILRPDGYVKVLDFGLAKLTEGETSATGNEEPTRALIGTDPGVVMGTASHMSPEQARARPVDARTDIWSLGVVLYEMVTGRMPFEGSTATEIIASVLEREPPPLARYTRGVPEALEWIVTKTLHKEREERYQSAKDLLIDLKGLKQRLQFEAQLERTVPPEMSSAPRSPTQSARLEETDKIATAHPTSSAEYFVTEIKRHKSAVAAALATLVIACAAIAYFYVAGNSRTTFDSIAVLPFVNAGADPNTDYVSDGITESIINSLSQIPKLRVVPRSSVFRYKGRQVDPQTAGRELNVRAVLTGRVVQRGDTLTIQTELIDVRNESQLWGQQYSRRPSDLLAMQEEIAKQITAKLRLELSSEEEKRLNKRYTANTEAYQFYLKGRYYWNKRSEEGFTKAAQYFQQAIDQDPNYALAYAGLADCYTLLGDYTYLPPGDALPKARAAAAKALEIDDSLAEGHASLAHVKMLYDWDWPSVEMEFKRSIQLNPGYATAHQWYALFLTALNRMDEAVVEQKRAQELDPLSLIINTDVGLFAYLKGQSDAAITQCEKTIEMDQKFVPAHFVMGLIYEQKGQFTPAIAEFKKAVELSGGNALMKASLAHAYAASGMKAEALNVLQELNQISKQHYVSPYEIAVIYAGLGEKDKAFEWLDKALQERSVWLIHLNVRADPRLSTLRSDPRFADLVRRLGLPQ